MDDELETRLQEHAEQLAALGAELDRQRTSFSARQAATRSSAALLVGAASISSGVRLGGDGNGWQTLAVVAALLGALLGVAALWPRQGREVSISGFVDILYTQGPRSTDWDLFKHKLAAHQDDERRLKNTGTYLRFGFLCLVLSILFSVLAIAGISVALGG